MYLGGIPWALELGSQAISAVFGTFLDFSGHNHIFSWNVHRKADVTYNVARVLGTICVCLKKPLNTPFVHFSWNLKLSRNVRKCIHIFVPSHMIPFQWPPMSLWGISWRPELWPSKSPKVVLTFNFGYFWDIFGLLRDWSYFFFLNTPRSADVTCNVA